MANRIWVLGATDPEMVLIERLLRSCLEAVAYATTVDGVRVSPRTAYSGAHCPEAAGYDEVILVECAPALPDDLPVTVIDHHRPGDPGYGRGPAEYWEASSIGQVCELLGAAPFDSLVIAAACDHCLAHAWAGHCPGVDPSDVYNYRAANAATRPIDPIAPETYRGRFDSTLDRLVGRFGGLLRIEPRMTVDTRGLGGRARCRPALRGAEPRTIVDTRSLGALPELPDVASYLGIPYLAEVADRDGRRKIVLGGATTPEMVREWMSTCGLDGVYGDPARGFAGGYLPGDV